MHLYGYSEILYCVKIFAVTDTTTLNSYFLYCSLLAYFPYNLPSPPPLSLPCPHPLSLLPSPSPPHKHFPSPSLFLSGLSPISRRSSSYQGVQRRSRDARTGREVHEGHDWLRISCQEDTGTTRGTTLLFHLCRALCPVLSVTCNTLSTLFLLSSFLLSILFLHSFPFLLYFRNFSLLP